LKRDKVWAKKQEGRGGPLDQKEKIRLGGGRVRRGQLPGNWPAGKKGGGRTRRQDLFNKRKHPEALVSVLQSTWALGHSTADKPPNRKTHGRTIEKERPKSKTKSKQNTRPKQLTAI